MTYGLENVELCLNELKAKIDVLVSEREQQGAPKAQQTGASVCASCSRDQTWGPPVAAPRPETVDALIVARGLRTRYFESDLLFDPVWSMLLDLFWSELNQQEVSVSSLCLASGVANTTALRYVDIMEEREMISRYPDEQDRRRTFIRLTDKTRESLAEYFSRIQALDWHGARS